MLRVYVLLALSSLVGLTWLAGCIFTAAQESPIKLISENGLELKVFDNSDTISQLLGINERGQVLGMREAVDETGSIFNQVFFFSDAAEIVDIPLLEEFTNIEAEALSDDGKVVGYVSRPMGHPDGSLAGFVWQKGAKSPTRLRPLSGDLVSHAQSISGDGQTISGYSTGSHPQRIRPCVWTWNTKSEKWDVEALPVIVLYNPFLTSGRAVISPDGNLIAASVTERIMPNEAVDNSLFHWRRQDGAWERRQVCSEAVRLNAVNNAGEVVGEFTKNAVRVPCHVDADGLLTEIEFLPGDVSGEASDINNEGMVVGFSDDPPGPEGGPQGFIWKDGKTMPLEMPADNLFSVAAGINDRGQIVGFADVTLGPAPAAGGVESTESEKPEPIVKTLGFIWSKKRESN